MKIHEVSTLLDRISGYDGRAFPPSAQASWLQLLAAYPLADCERAVDEHYAVNDTRIMPTHIRSRCITLRDLRAAEERRALPAPSRPVLTEVGKAARAEVFRLIAAVGSRSEAAMRPPMRADASEPTSADSTIDELERRRQMRRLEHGR